MKKVLVIILVIIVVGLLSFLGLKILKTKKDSTGNRAFLYNRGNLLKDKNVEKVELDNINEIDINSKITTINLRHSETEVKEIQIVYWGKKDDSFSLENKNGILSISHVKTGIIEEISGNIGKNINVNIYSNKSNVYLNGLTGGNILFQCNEIFVNMKDLANIANFSINSNNSSLEYNNCNIQNFTGNLENTHLFFNKCSIEEIKGKGNELYAKIKDCNFNSLYLTFLNGFLDINGLRSNKLLLSANNSRIVVSNCSFEGGKLNGTKVYLNINDNKVDKIQLKLTDSIIRSDSSLKNRIDLDNNIAFYAPKNK